LAQSSSGHVFDSADMHTSHERGHVAPKQHRRASRQD
jgi:hypothetical protein